MEFLFNNEHNTFEAGECFDELIWRRDMICYNLDNFVFCIGEKWLIGKSEK